MLKNIFKLNKLSFKNYKIKHFSTLIIPEIVENKVHQSVNNINTAANQLDDDVIIIIKFKTHILLYGDKDFSDELINSVKKIKNLKKILIYKNENLKNP